MSKVMYSAMQKKECLKQIASNPAIPSPPTVILQVLEKASKQDCTIADLCNIIQMDPGLSGKILRIVNSALFGLSRPATSIQRALAVVGINAARLLVLAIAMPEMYKNFSIDPLIVQRYWQSAISGAIVACELSRRFRSRESEDDMACGLLRDTGALVLQQVFPKNARDLACEPEQALVQTVCELEEMHFGFNHAEVSAFILDRWRLPPDMTEAIRWHHDAAAGRYSTPKAETRAYTLQFATLAAQLLEHPEFPFVLRCLYQLGNERFRMSETEVQEFLSPLSQKAADLAALLRVDIGKSSDFGAALARASEELVVLSMSTSIETQRASEMTRRAEAEAAHWKNEAAFDPLTRLFNRRYFERKLCDYLGCPRPAATQFGLLFLDLDGFKRLNDRFGHAFGDIVLQRVASCLQEAVRQVDIVARFGGDEFCILTEHLDPAGLRTLAERLLGIVQELTIQHGECAGRVGVSIGGVCQNASTDWGTPERILAGADHAMYQAKSGGKNRFVYLEPSACSNLETSPILLAENPSIAERITGAHL